MLFSSQPLSRRVTSSGERQDVAAVAEESHQQNIDERRPMSLVVADLVVEHKSFILIVVPILIRLLNELGENEDSVFSFLLPPAWKCLQQVWAALQFFRFPINLWFQKALSTHLLCSSTLFVFVSASWAYCLLKPEDRERLYRSFLLRLNDRRFPATWTCILFKP